MRVIHLARKPLSEGSVAANVLLHGVGGLNIDGSRVPTRGEHVVLRGVADPRKRGGAVPTLLSSTKDIDSSQQAQRESIERTNRLGRWPSNVVLEHQPSCRLSVWECAEGCPVIDLGAAEDGEASRFYKQIGGEPCE